MEKEAVDRLRRATLTVRPLGSIDFVEQLEHQLQRKLTPAKRGRKPRNTLNPQEAIDSQQDLFR